MRNPVTQNEEFLCWYWSDHTKIDSSLIHYYWAYQRHNTVPLTLSSMAYSLFHSNFPLRRDFSASPENDLLLRGDIFDAQVA